MATIVNEKPKIDADGELLPPAILQATADLDQRDYQTVRDGIRSLVDQRNALIRLVREALCAFEDPQSIVDIRDWCQAARTAIGKPEPRS